MLLFPRFRFKKNLNSLLFLHDFGYICKAVGKILEANRGNIEEVFGQNIKYVYAHKAFSRSLTGAMNRGILKSLNIKTYFEYSFEKPLSYLEDGSNVS